MKKTILIALVLMIGLSAEVTKADFIFGEPVNLETVIPVIDPARESICCLSYDELEIYIASDRPGGSGNFDIWVLKRASTDDDWELPENLGPTINSPKNDEPTSISSDGLILYFHSSRDGGYGNGDMYKTTRADRNEQWGPVENLGSTINSSSADGVPYISSDGLELYFNSLRTGGYGGADIYVSKRDITNEPWGEPENLGPLVNSEYYDGNPCISPDGLLLFFSDWHKGTPRPGGYGGADIWVTRRASHLAPWETAVNLGPPVNGIAHEIIPRLSPDGLMLYFTTLAGDVWDNWQTPILPIVDLNSDGIVDAVDMCIIVDNWGIDNKLCDIGPMPWGDGVVDVEDLKVLAEHLFEVYPSADTVDIDEADDGGQVELELGKLLVVTLESNPSTGYRWELIENNDVILKQFGEVEFQSSDTSDSPMVGTSGWEIFRFKAVSAGQTTLELVYHRSWEDAEPLKTFSIQVTVP